MSKQTVKGDGIAETGLQFLNCTEFLRYAAAVVTAAARTVNQIVRARHRIIIKYYDLLCHDYRIVYGGWVFLYNFQVALRIHQYEVGDNFLQDV